jgi:hypothetical protein
MANSCDRDRGGGVAHTPLGAYRRLVDARSLRAIAHPDVVEETTHRSEVDVSAHPSHFQTAPNAVLSLVLGILGLIVGVTAPLAWKYGKAAEAAVDASGGTLSGRDVATVGKVMGIVGTAMVCVAFILMIPLVVFSSP